MNFGTGGNFGPLQYALLYKTMAADFDHTMVVVGVLPDNDFHDMDYAYWKSIGEGQPLPSLLRAGSFRLLRGTFDPNDGQGAWDHVEAILRAYLASYHVGQYLYSRLYWRTRGVYSGYNDMSDTDLARLQAALKDIKATAGGARGPRTCFLNSARERLPAAASERRRPLGPVMERGAGTLEFR